MWPISSETGFRMPGPLSRLRWAHQFGQSWSGLQRNPDPTVEYERGQAFEPAMLSINSVRGKAMHAIIQYALWRRRRMNDEGVTGGFDTMPEVRALLDGHLERDPSPAVRSVYAQYFPALVYLDANWAAAVAPLVFPASEEDVRFWRAAWSAYAIFAQTFDKVFDILRPTYELAVQRMPWSENPETPTAETERIGATPRKTSHATFWPSIGVENSSSPKTVSLSGSMSAPLCIRDRRRCGLSPTT